MGEKGGGLRPPFLFQVYKAVKNIYTQCEVNGHTLHVIGEVGLCDIDFGTQGQVRVLWRATMKGKRKACRKGWRKAAQKDYRRVWKKAVPKEGQKACRKVWKKAAPKG